MGHFGSDENDFVNFILFMENNRLKRFLLVYTAATGSFSSSWRILSPISHGPLEIPPEYRTMKSVVGLASSGVYPV
jgi:hypothetical protein